MPNTSRFVVLEAGCQITGAIQRMIMFQSSLILMGMTGWMFRDILGTVKRTDTEVACSECVCGLGLNEEEIHQVIAQFEKFFETSEPEIHRWEEAIEEPDYSDFYP